MKLVLALFAALFALAAAGMAADISGKWQAESQNPDVGQVTFEFKITGEQLTGSVDSNQGAWEIADGKVSGDEVSFRLASDEFKVVFKGKITGNLIQFNATYNEERAFELTAKKVS